MQTESGTHSAEELFEKYVFGQLTEEGTARLEEHLLACEHCQARLSEIEEYLDAAQSAAAELRKQQYTWIDVLLGRGWRVPKPVWAIGLAVLAICVLIPFRPQSRPDTQRAVTTSTVQLIPMMGAGTEASAHVSSQSQLLLRIEASRLKVMPSYEIEVADASGSQVWKAPVSPKAGRLVALVPQKLAAGTYWVRVYGGSDLLKLLQEYKLDVQ